MNRLSMATHRWITVVAALCWSAPAPGADITCWFPPKYPAESAKRIADALSAAVPVHARVAQSYPEIIDALGSKGNDIAYVGSFVQAIIAVRQSGVTLVQAVDGKEFYGAWMIYPKGGDPAAILAQSPGEIAFAKGATSGESGAKAATDGRAAIATASHDASIAALQSGKAKAAFVKSWWWEANKARYPGLDAHRIPGISDAKNPDNVLTASTAIDPAVRKKLKAAALKSPEAFGAKSMTEFGGDLSFTIALMKRGKIDAVAYLFE